MTNYAQSETKSAPLSSAFGREFLMRRFDPEIAAFILEAFGTYQKGKNKGLQRGYIVWTKITKGGWKRDMWGGESANGHRGYVAKPGTFDVRVSLMYGGEDAQALYADTANWKPMPVDEELAETCKAKGIDCAAITEEGRKSHIEQIKKWALETVEAAKKAQQNAYTPRYYR